MKKDLLAFERRLVIDASAGSGKTYQLAKRFIHLLYLHLTSSSKHSSNLCKTTHTTVNDIIAPNSLGSIVAITFTNKAAAEMKERILLFLKKLSSIYKDDNFNKSDFAISKDNALRALIEIIKNLGELNVTTIDSFMNRIIKAFSVDLNIYPDYDVSFNSDEIFQFAVDELISDINNQKDLIKFLQDMLYLGKKGINGERIILNSLQDFQNIDIPNNVANLNSIIKIFTKNFGFKNLSYNKIKDEIEEKIKKESTEINKLIESNKTVFNGNKIRSYKNIDIKKATEKISQIKQLIENNNLESILKKDKKLNEQDSRSFITSLNKCYELSAAYIILKHTYQTNSIAKQLIKLKDKEKDIRFSLNIIDGSKIAKSVGDILNTDYGVSEAFCKLGEKITHYLIDEFQDTSKEQFEALYALIENGVAEGGSLFVVGDKKQAIYAWRGGDYTIFNTLLLKKELDIKTQTTENNYRSKSNIVTFNNDIFSLENLLEALSTLFEESFKSLITKDIDEIYKSSKQLCITGDGGYVEVSLKTVQNNDKNFDIDNFYRDKIKQTIKKVVEDKHIPLSNIMILLRTKKEIRKVTDWLMEDFPTLKFITDDSLLLMNNFEIKRFLFLVSSILFKEEKRYEQAFDEIGLNFNVINELYNKSQNSSAYEFFCYILEKENFNLDDNKIYFNKLLEETLILTQKQKSLYEIVDYFYKNTDIYIELPENIEALKITTIHKSKGLESHTVIIPFYDWKLYDAKNIDIYGTFSIIDFTNNNDVIFAKVDKNLRSISEDANRAYMNQLKINFIEALNLAYVANTRAKENLFIFGINSVNKDGTISKNLTVANLIHKILFKENKEDYEIGKLESFQATKQIKKNDNEHYIINTKIGSSIRDHLKIYQPHDITIDIYEKLYGELFHLAISYIDILHKDEDLKQIATKVYSKAASIMNFEDKNIIEDIILSIEKLKNYFIDIEQCWNEKELVSKQGEIFRIDRLVRKNSNYFIIDYKTGAFNTKHQQQIKNYMKLFKNGAKGVLYYTKSKEIVNVS